MSEVPLYLKPTINITVQSDRCKPSRANPSDAGVDLIARDSVWLQKDKRTLVPTGVFVEIPVGNVGLLVPRSSLSKSNVIMTNSVGIIDSDYRGEIMASLMYIGDNMHGHTIVAGDRIVQLVIVPILLPSFIITDKLSDTDRDTGGFGSTGK
jgi:dUTP pyrophosphatase